VTEPGRYIFRFGWLTVTAEDLAVWEQFPNAAFTLVTTAAATDVVGEEFRLGTFETRRFAEQTYPHIFRRGADYVDKILKGEKPGNIPVELPMTAPLALASPLPEIAISILR